MDGQYGWLPSSSPIAAADASDEHQSSRLQSTPADSMTIPSYPPQAHVRQAYITASSRFNRTSTQPQHLAHSRHRRSDHSGRESEPLISRSHGSIRVRCLRCSGSIDCWQWQPQQWQPQQWQQRRLDRAAAVSGVHARLRVRRAQVQHGQPSAAHSAVHALPLLGLSAAAHQGNARVRRTGDDHAAAQLSVWVGGRHWHSFASLTH